MANPYAGKEYREIPTHVKVRAKPFGSYGAGVDNAGIEINHGEEIGMKRYAIGEVFTVHKDIAIAMIQQGRLEWADPNAKVSAA